MYPAFVKLAGRSCVVVGGGDLGFQKTVELLRCGARVHVVAPAWPADFSPLDRNPGLTRETRPFAPADLARAFLAVAATDDPEVQASVWNEAERLGILCNVVDVPDRCNFYVPASLRRGPLTVSVSTAGKSPLFAVALRDRLRGMLDERVGAGLDLLGEARKLVREKYPESQERRSAALRRLVTPEAVDELIEGRLDAFEARWTAWTSSLSD
jgi:siroheme synthase-like protein